MRDYDHGHLHDPDLADDDDFDEPEEDDFDCHMDRDGFCGKAGSEECEFECPYRGDDE